MLLNLTDVSCAIYLCVGECVRKREGGGGVEGSRIDCLLNKYHGITSQPYFITTKSGYGYAGNKDGNILYIQ